MAKSYYQKLKDPRWQRKRLEVLNRDNFCCRNCGNSKETLHVHHIQYLKGKEPWQYPDMFLLTLCEGCHVEAENDNEKIKRDIARLVSSGVSIETVSLCVSALQFIADKDPELFTKVESMLIEAACS